MPDACIVTPVEFLDNMPDSLGSWRADRSESAERAAKVEAVAPASMAEATSVRSIAGRP